MKLKCCFNLSTLLAMTCLTVSSLMMSAAPAHAGSKDVKNVFLMISDGAGYNTWKATSMYRGKLGSELYNGAGWVNYACSTHPLNLSATPLNTNIQDPNVVYDSSKAWDTTSQAVQGGGTGAFAGYNFVKTTYTDSAAAMTAISAGLKTYNNALNWSDLGTPLTTIHEIMKAQGKATGAISSVEWSHATPAGVIAHNVSRNNYAEIANEMLNSSADVIFGAGNPDYNDNNTLTSSKDYKYVGGSTTWNQLKNGTHASGRTLVESKADFEALVNGPTSGKYVGTAKTRTTLQQNRSGYSSSDTPYSDPFNIDVPSLMTMTKAALNILDENPNGMFLMVEGGAVDWANHANQMARMIEEQIDFLDSVQAVYDWIEANSNWEESMIIITADHECGLLWGPNSDTIAFDEIVDNGAGNMPGFKYNYGSHTNSLVPVWAKGGNSDRYEWFVQGIDPVYGKYIDNTNILHGVVPEPSAVVALTTGLLGLAGILRRRNKA